MAPTRRGHVGIPVVSPTGGVKPRYRWSVTELAPNAPASAADRFAEFKFGRIPIGKVSPVIEHGAYPAKAVEGEALPISARIYREGHDAVGATAVLTSPSGEQTRLDMNPVSYTHLTLPTIYSV